MMVNILALDIDLHKIFAVDDRGYIHSNGFPLYDLPEARTTLLEVASPVSFARGGSANGVMFNLAKWAIYNTAKAMELHKQRPDSLLVAPSNKWTRGYDVKTRHAMACATARNKDLRECQTMIWFFKKRPEDWVSLPDYLRML